MHVFHRIYSIVRLLLLKCCCLEIRIRKTVYKRLYCVSNSLSCPWTPQFLTFPWRWLGEILSWHLVAESSECMCPEVVHVVQPPPQTRQNSPHFHQVFQTQTLCTFFSNPLGRTNVLQVPPGGIYFIIICTIERILSNTQPLESEQKFSSKALILK